MKFKIPRLNGSILKSFSVMLYRVIADRSEGDLKAIRPSKVSIGVAANKADPNGAGDVQLLEVSPHCVILCSRVH